MSAKKIAIINDISGYGRCSTSVVLPIVSHLGIQGCALPTAIFSNHTGFPSFYRDDYTRKMPLYMDEWRKLGLSFDGIMSGFLGSSRQIGIVEEFIQEFRTPETVVLVDPVMGDNGRIYPTYTAKMCREMKKLLAYADIITPNLTEACFLTDTPYREGGWRYDELNTMAQQLMDMGAHKLVITGIKVGSNFIGNAVAQREKPLQLQRQMLIKHTRSGTGDVFASVLGADAVNGLNFPYSVKRASLFVQRCLRETIKSDGPTNTGIEFEPLLAQLKRG